MENELEIKNGEEGVKLDTTLRPSSFDEYVGQSAVKNALKIILQAASQRAEAPEHILVSGPPGLGKTTLAMLVSKELNVSLRTTSGPAIERAGDMAALLTSLKPNEVLFIDEIHRLPKIAEEILYPAMEDFGLDVILGKGMGARSVRLEVPRFTLIGATTRPDLLSAPLRDRFGASFRLEYYDLPDITKIIERSAKILGIEVNEEALQAMAERARSTPRIANRLLKRVRDYAQVLGHDKVRLDSAQAAFEAFSVDSLGLDRLDRQYLQILAENFEGGPAGVSAIAAALGEEMATVEEVIEPFLLQRGLIQRSPRGRVLSDLGRKHLGKNQNLEFGM